MNTTTPIASTSTTPQTAVGRLVGLAEQQEGCAVGGSPLQGLTGDILRALEGAGIYRAGPPGLPCSILSAQTIADYETTSLTTIEHVVTDETMVSLLQDLPSDEWKEYLDGQFSLTLTEQYSTEVYATALHKPTEERESMPADRRCYNFLIDGRGGGLQCWGLWWQKSDWKEK